MNYRGHEIRIKGAAFEVFSTDDNGDSDDFIYSTQADGVQYFVDADGNGIALCIQGVVLMSDSLEGLKERIDTVTPTEAKS